MSELSVAQIGAICGGEPEGNGGRVIRRANTLEFAAQDEVAFSASAKTDEAATQSHAGCLIVRNAFTGVGNWTVIRVPDPRTAFVRVLAALSPSRQPASGIHPTASIAATAQIGVDCSVGPFVVIGEHSILGPNCFVGAHTSIGDRVTVGAHTTIHAQTTIYDDVTLGSRVTLHSGSVIGADGFGFALAGDHYEKFPQVGTVAIEDDVEIGANSCVDRAALGITRIGSGTKIDNLVHIAHNCVVGKHVVIAAQTGFSGGVEVGDYAVIGGQTGVGEKGRISARAVVGAKSGVLTGRTIPAGEPVWGIPARPLRQHLKGLANVNKLSELRNDVRELQRKLAAHPTQE